MLVFRSTREERTTARLTSELRGVLEQAEHRWNAEAACEALLRAGELECGVADSSTAFADEARVLGRLTDAIARSCITREPCPGETSIALASVRPRTVQVSEPEGYAYYRLEPCSYASCVEQVELDAPVWGVIGIRSIGTSLSAVVSAALRRRGVEAERTTVRPTGHPWARTLSLDSPLRRWIQSLAQRGATFAIVDEGPGLSGSTFIAVADALEMTGISPARIRLFCSHVPDPQSFTSEHARSRWMRYTVFTPAVRLPERVHDLSGGIWRRRVLGPDSARWPACWTQLERIKQSTEDGRWVDKFEGLPPYCQPALARASELARAGYAPPATYLEGGMVRYPWLEGRAAEPGDLAHGALERIAEYCAFRARAFRIADADGTALQDMVEVNVREALGVELGGCVSLPVECPVIADARMQPYEWCVTREGAYFKLDGHGDGSGHLLPGPCDVCWDLAGAIVEWQMNDAQAEALVRSFERRAEQRVASRVSNYRLAYCAYRCGAMSLAALSATEDEAPRIARAYEGYRRALVRCWTQSC